MSGGGVIIKSVLLQRGLGKTTALIKNSAKTGDLLVVLNESMVRHTMKMAKDLNVEIKIPITHLDYIDYIYGHRTNSVNNHRIRTQISDNGSFIIDDLDLFLQDTLARKTGARISLVSFTI